MEVIEITKKILKNWRFNYFPKGHMVAISLLGISLAGFTIFPNTDASALRRSEVIEIPVFDSELSASASIIDIEDQFEEEIETDHLVSNVQTVKSGDNLSKIFNIMQENGFCIIWKCLEYGRVFTKKMFTAIQNHNALLDEENKEEEEAKTDDTPQTANS